MIQIALYVPVALVVCLVLATLREDSPKAILRTALKNFAILTGVLAAGSAVITLMGTYL
jgi:hypothetical protein